MKKKLILLLLVLALLPVRVLASGIEDYKENDKQAVIYMFRGDGCGYCRAFLTFLYSIVDEYGDKFKLVSFETWGDQKNAELFEKVLKHNGDDPSNSGVPYIVIGEKIFRGYAIDGSWDEDIKKAITDQYNNPKSDLMKTLKVSVKDYNTLNFTAVLEAEQLPEQETEPTEEKSTGVSSVATIFWNAAIVIAGTVAIIVVNNKNTERVLAALNKKEPKETKKKEK